ncbi:MAG: hypothetical protein J5685_13070 [Clostridiales bacterium]|nr:hypothetical protein [Clostridiales bacterium]
MGSTLESALILPVIILVITGFVIWPLYTAQRSYRDFISGTDEIDQREPYGTDIDVEDLNTFLAGLSDNYRMVYGGVMNAVSEEE